MLNSMKIINYLDYRPKYDINKCVKSKSSKSTCDKCSEACIYDAIQLHKKGIKVTDNCKHCGLCVAYCPSNALIDGGRKFCRNKDEVFVVCPFQTKEDTKDHNIKVDCLRFFSTKILFNLYIRGIRKIHINTDKCKDCLYSQDIEKELNLVNQILNQLNKPLMVIEEIEVDMVYNGAKTVEIIKSGETVDRRNFFKQFAKEVFSMGYELAPPSMKEDGWQGLNEIIKQLETEEIKGVSLYKVRINESKCIECNACMKLCPEDVWEATDEQLKTENCYCNGCELCKDICPTKAIRVIKDVHIAGVRIESKKSKICNSCNKKFSTYFEEKILCTKCIAKTAFGIKD